VSTKTFIYTHDQAVLVTNELRMAMNTCSIITLQGSLGAGKTTLVRALLGACGVDMHVQSPTFSYLQVYNNTMGHRFYHFDLYRVTTLWQLQQIGFDEYVYQDKSWVIIEWPEIVQPLLKHGVCHVNLSYALSDENARIATVLYHHIDAEES
jgi:tRNA threonylcarbamoyladenosine biosynthesis protein TsaE